MANEGNIIIFGRLKNFLKEIIGSWVDIRILSLANLDNLAYKVYTFAKSYTHEVPSSWLRLWSTAAH